MADRIIKDIRYYESSVENIAGNSMPGNLGKIFHATGDTNYIGQRIARKLNELEFSYGEFDHIYINLTTAINENDLVISKRDIDKRIKYIDYGLLPATYNRLSNADKNRLIKTITFRILKHISIADNSNMQRIEEVELLMERDDSEIQILYKTKETANYKIEISYQIKPIGSATRAIVTYLDKKDNSERKAFIPLQWYEDIYSLIDTIVLKDGVLVFNPKKSYIAELSNNRYVTPIKLKISELDRV